MRRPTGQHCSMPRRRSSLENTRPAGQAHGAAPFLREIVRRGDGDAAGFPFSVPAIQTLGNLSLDSAVTFFVGENGSGKSTLLEAIAAAARLPAVGSADL